MFTNTEAFSGFAVGDLEAARKFYEPVVGGSERSLPSLLVPVRYWMLL